MYVSLNKYANINKTLTQGILYTSHAIHPMKKIMEERMKTADARHSASKMMKVVKWLCRIK